MYTTIKNNPTVNLIYYVEFMQRKRKPSNKKIIIILCLFSCQEGKGLSRTGLVYGWCTRELRGCTLVDYKWIPVIQVIPDNGAFNKLDILRLY